MNQESPETPNVKKKQSLDLAQLAGMVKPLSTFFKRHLVLMFIVLALSALIYAVVMVNMILQQSSAGESTAGSKYELRFDQETIDKIDDLRSRDQAVDVTLPSGRINPFSE